MIKSIFGAKRRPGMSREEFGGYGTTTHAGKARQLPGRVGRRAKPCRYKTDFRVVVDAYQQVGGS